MVSKIKHLSESISFILLGLSLILLITAEALSNVAVTNSKITFFCILGGFSLIVGILDLVINNITEEAKFANYLYWFIFAAVILEGIYNYYINGSYILSLVLTLISGFGLLCDLVYNRKKEKTTITNFDKYFTFSLRFASFLIIITYSFFKIMLQIWTDNNLFIYIILVIFLIAFCCSYIINYALEIKEELKLERTALKQVSSIFVLLLYGLFLVLLSGSYINLYELKIFEDGGLVGIVVCGLVSIVLSIILFIVFRKNRNNNGFDGYYLSLVSMVLVEMLFYVMTLLKTGINDFFIFIPWTIILFVPLVACFVKFTLSEAIGYSLWFDVVSDFFILVFYISMVIFHSVSYSAFGEKNLVSLFFLCFLSILISISVLTHSIINTIEIFKGKKV